MNADEKFAEVGVLGAHRIESHFVNDRFDLERVTLFARDTFQIKAIVYEMRFDPVSAEYADFGEFFIGIQLPLDELFRRLQL